MYNSVRTVIDLEMTNVVKYMLTTKTYFANSFSFIAYYYDEET